MHLASLGAEIWVPSVKDRSDFQLVLSLVLGDGKSIVNNTNNATNNSDAANLLINLCEPMLDYVEWFNNEVCGSKDSIFVDFTLSLRDILSWARFIVACTSCDKQNITSIWQAYLHGAALMHLDGLGLGTGLNVDDARSTRISAYKFLKSKIPSASYSLAVENFDIVSDKKAEVVAETETAMEDDDEVEVEVSSLVVSTPERFGILPFTIQTGPTQISRKESDFSMTAPTTGSNIRRVIRAMQLTKPVLLEGSPGVGKTSLIEALAKASGHKLVRINLSEQTDISDLMGSDLPVDNDSEGEGGGGGAKFSWCDGVFLRALKNGDWVLLDELNLASQSVLEGLNSCLDHRAQVYISELSKTFDCPKSFRVFAAQNPLAQGGGRKGLPKSFLNR